MSTYFRNIGIDFGTSTTVLCYLDHIDGQPVAVEPSFVEFDSSRLLDSLIFEQSGVLCFGKDALAAAENTGQTNALIRNFKMDLLLADKRPSAEKRMLQMFIHLHDQYVGRRFVRGGVSLQERTIVSYPAKWPQPLREATIEAAKQAGFPDVHGMDEPSAAMQFFLYHSKNALSQLEQDEVIESGKPITVLLIDMGAGTTDFVLYRSTPGSSDEHQILTIWPPSDGVHLGGRDIDRLLGSFVTKYMMENLTISPDRFEAEDERIGEVKTHKEQSLSPDLAAGKTVEHFRLINDYRKLGFLKHDARPYRIDRTALEGLVHDHLNSFCELSRGLVEDAAQQQLISGGEDIDVVILTGGHSKWYFMRDLLCDRPFTASARNLWGADGPAFPKLAKNPKRLLESPDPQTIVARGLVLSGLHVDDRPVKIKKRAGNNLWYDISLESVDGVRIAGTTLAVAGRGEELPIVRKVYCRLPVNYPSMTASRVVSRVVPIVGKASVGGSQFTAHTLFHDLNDTTRIISNLGARILPTIKHFFGRFLSSSTTDTIDHYIDGKLAGHLDLYFEIEIDDTEQASYVGVLDLDVARKPFVVFHNRDGVTAAEGQALWQSLAQERATTKSV